MIFLIDVHENTKLQVSIYESLHDVSRRVEWQDILDPNLKILDDKGNLYAWNDAKTSENATVYDYTFKRTGSDPLLLQKCLKQYHHLGQPQEFVFTLSE